MSETVPEKPRSPVAARLESACVDLRRDLDVSRHVDGDEVHYVVRDPLTFASHRLTRADYDVFVRIDSRRTLGEIFAASCAGGRLDEEDEEGFYEFVVALHRLGFLDLPIPDEEVLYERHEARARARRAQRALGIFFLQIPMWNPDAFLERSAALGRLLFSRAAFALWVVLQAAALWIAATNLEGLREPLGQVLVAGNLPVLWGTLIGLKVVHEFGHAWACKRFGGHVPEMGIYLIAFTPCAYVDASASWGFEDRWKRLVVAFAGMYFELAVAALALFVWLLAESPFVESVAFNVVVLASVATVAFNANPMMKSDGYFAISDMLGIPNLRSRATRYASGFLGSLVLGTPRPAERSSIATRILFLAFGALLPFYRASVVLGISLAIASKLFALGLLLGIGYIVMEAAKILGKLVRLFFLAEETSGMRFRAATVGVLTLVAIPALLSGVPLPGGVVVDGAIRAEREEVVRARTSGFLTRAPDPEVRRVAAGALVAEIVDPEIDRRLLEARARLREAEIRFRAAEAEGPDAADSERGRLDSARAEVEDLRRRIEDRRSEATLDGRLIGERDALVPGRWVREGEPLARILGGELEVRALVSQSQMARAAPRPGDVAEFRPRSAPDLTLVGEVVEVRVRASDRVEEEALTQAGGGSIVLDPVTGRARDRLVEIRCRFGSNDVERFCAGTTGRLRLDAVPQSLAVIVRREIAMLLDRLRDGTGR